MLRSLAALILLLPRCASTHTNPAAEQQLQAYLDAFQADLQYAPTLENYVVLASMLFKTAPAPAAAYYRSALSAVPSGAATLRQRRVLTDQLAMSLGMAGDLAASRAVLHAAVHADPDYPLNFYNLACADAEQGDARAARLRLELAFAHKRNTMPSETLPDPTQDDSLQKLRTDKAFWAYATSLSQH